MRFTNQIQEVMIKLQLFLSILTVSEGVDSLIKNGNQKSEKFH